MTIVLNFSGELVGPVVPDDAKFIAIVTVGASWKVATFWINGMDGRVGSSAQTVEVEISLTGGDIAHPDEIRISH